MSILYQLPNYSSLLLACLPEDVTQFKQELPDRDHSGKSELFICQTFWKHINKYSKEQIWHSLLPHTQAILLLNWGWFNKPTDIFRGTNPYELLEVNLVRFLFNPVPSPDLNTAPFDQILSSHPTTSSSELSDLNSENEMAP